MADIKNARWVRVLTHPNKLTPRDYFISFSDAVHLAGQGQLALWMNDKGFWVARVLPYTASPEEIIETLEAASRDSDRSLEITRFANEMLEYC